VAVFYTNQLSVQALLIAATCLVVLALMKWRGVTSVSSYLWVGLIMWVSVLKSGVHATLAGVALAGFIPMAEPANPERSPLRELEHDLHGLVAYFVLPVFAFANAGVSFAGVGVTELLHPVPLGIATGLFVGKQLGIFGFCWLAIKSGLARLPAGASWAGLYGVSVLCGVGFTMSLFIGSLAFENTATQMREIFDERLGILLGSLLSGILGFAVLYKALPRSTTAGDTLRR
jgi:NhaA family Na+:H+ antiporter